MMIDIETAEWKYNGFDLVLTVRDENDLPVNCYLSKRPPHCDRGHFQLLVDGRLKLDSQDCFPRYFFSFDEADKHTRAFLMWRIWKMPGDIGMDKYEMRKSCETY